MSGTYDDMQLEYFSERIHLQEITQFNFSFVHLLKYEVKRDVCEVVNTVNIVNCLLIQSFSD